MNDGGPAFPVAPHPNGQWDGHPGMSLRAWLAGQAMQGMLADSECVWTPDKAEIALGITWAGKCAAASCVLADALLAELAKERVK